MACISALLGGNVFNEREALRLRLEQLNNAEIQAIRELQNERKDIYSRLRELDHQKVSSSKTSISFFHPPSRPLDQTAFGLFFQEIYSFID